MSIIQVASKLEYSVNTPTSFIFSIAAAYTDRQTVQTETLTVTPNTNYQWFDLGVENNRSIRFLAQPGPLTVDYQATVVLNHEVDQPRQLNEVPYLDLPTNVLPYLNPSRYCEVDRLAHFAYKTFGDMRAGYSRVDAICDWVYNRLDYLSGSTNASSSACDVFIQRAGVCRDFAHLSITLCRALGIPARYVAGYAPELQPPDFHGFFEAFLDGKWYLFDATKMAPIGGFVRISAGRDAADASFANIVGSTSLQTMMVSAYNTSTQNTPNATMAISTA